MVLIVELYCTWKFFFCTVYFCAKTFEWLINYECRVNWFYWRRYTPMALFYCAFTWLLRILQTNALYLSIFYMPDLPQKRHNLYSFISTVSTPPKQVFIEDFHLFCRLWTHAGQPSSRLQQKEPRLWVVPTRCRDSTVTLTRLKTGSMRRTRHWITTTTDMIWPVYKHYRGNMKDSRET